MLDLENMLDMLDLENKIIKNTQQPYKTIHPAISAEDSK